MSDRSWLWVVAFCAATCFIYFHSLKEKSAALRDLTFRLEEMEKERLLAMSDREMLGLTLASQDDPAWIEMILMRDLGLVPEGFLKVHFKK
jgi:hypothetical protein